MPFPIHNPFVSKILPVTLLKSKVLTLVVRYRSDSKRSGGGGCRPYVQNPTCTKKATATGPECAGARFSRNHSFIW